MLQSISLLDQALQVSNCQFSDIEWVRSRYWMGMFNWLPKVALRRRISITVIGNLYKLNG